MKRNIVPTVIKSLESCNTFECYCRCIHKVPSERIKIII